MRIIHAIDSAGVYGAEAVLLELAAGLSCRGHECIVASMGRPGCGEKPLESAAKESGLPVRRVTARRGPDLSATVSLLKLAWRERADVVHSHGYKSDILLGFAPRKVRRVPLVVTVHGYTHTRRWGRMAVYSRLDRLALRGADAVVLVQQGMTAIRGLDQLHRPGWRVIENGLPSVTRGVHRDGLDERTVRFCQQRPVVGAIARLSPEKGLSQLIEAMGILARRGRSIRAVLLGDGSQRPELEALAGVLRVSSQVLLPGYLGHARNYLPLFDAFVLPSLTEGLPITLLEAMHARVPIVATRVGGVPDALQQGRGGLLVEPNDPERLASAIERILDDRPLAEELAAFSAAEVEGRFSSDRMVERYLELYRHVAA